MDRKRVREIERGAEEKWEERAKVRARKKRKRDGERDLEGGGEEREGDNPFARTKFNP